MRLVLKQGSKLALAGIALGVACAWGLTRWMTSLLFEVRPAGAVVEFTLFWKTDQRWEDRNWPVAIT